MSSEVTHLLAVLCRHFLGAARNDRPAWIEEALIELHELTGARGGEDEPDEGGTQRR